MMAGTTFAILFTLEGSGGGGNDYSFYLAVFLQTGAGYRYFSDARVGGKASRTLGFHSIQNGVIHLSTKFHSKNADGSWDAACCPSGVGQAHYALRGSKLVELSTSPY